MQDIIKKTEAHPCYNCSAGRNARIHLPVASRCNIQCNYCVRKFDCPNESRPGVTTKVLCSKEAADWFAACREEMDNLKVVGIAGPGDALANFKETSETLKLVKQIDPDITICLSTNGLMLPHFAQELIDLDVTHVTVTLNTVDPLIGAKIYKHVDYMGYRYYGEEAAQVLLKNQLRGLHYLADRGVVCKVNTVALRGINEDYITDISGKLKEVGVYIHNVMKMIPVKGSTFEELVPLNDRELSDIRDKGGAYLRQMRHCKQCRADAVGTLGVVGGLQG